MTIADLREVADVIRQPVLVVSPGGEILVANAAARALSASLAAGNRLADALHDPETVGDSVRRWLRHGTAVPGRLVVRHPDGPLSCQAEVVRLELEDGPVVLIQVLEGRNAFAQLNDQLQRLQREVRYREALQKQRDEALLQERAARERVERLLALTSDLAGALTVSETVNVILARVPAAAGVDQATVRLVGDLARGHAAAAKAVVAEGDEALRRTGSEPFADALAGQAELAFESPAELQARYPHLAGTQVPGQPHLALVLPLSTTGGEPLGVLGLWRFGVAGSSPEERTLARAIAAQCAQALERAHLHDKDRRFAENLQRALLPRHLPRIQGLAMAVRYLPATERSAVGGDWYDVIDLGHRRIALVVGDVAGHGLEAATAMAEMRSALRGLATAFGTPAAVLGAFNRFVYRQLPAEMATVLYIVADLDADTVSYAKAGHPPPLLVEAGEATYLREALAPPIGIAGDMAYEEAQRTLKAPWRIVAYTDGLVERRDEPIDVGLRRLARASVATAADAEALCDHVIASLVGGAELSDDAAVLVATGSVQPGEAGRHEPEEARGRSARREAAREENGAPPDRGLDALVAHHRTAASSPATPARPPGRAQAIGWRRRRPRARGAGA